jgi:hypothetical protein
VEILKQEKVKNKRRILFSPNFIQTELQVLNDFRAIFREIINLMNSKKEFLKFIFMEDDQKSEKQKGDLQILKS